MSKINLIYDNYAYWEKDYILELFSNLKCNVIYIEKGNFEKLEEYQIINSNNVLVFSSNIYTFEEILNVVLKINPTIIIHLSDEYGNKPKYTHLALYTKLLLHQYHFNHYPYNNYNNIIQIPLGYMTNMFNGEKSLNYKIKPILERKYKWSFIGNIKQDRKELIDKFQRITPNFVGNNISALNVSDIYNDSIFVTNGRGNVVIDCFRIYEAILCGSIPIFVCDEKEFNNSFYYNNNIPPFIFEKSWDNAVDKCEYLLNNMEELENIAKKNYEWLETKIKEIKYIISKHILVE